MIAYLTFIRKMNHEIHMIGIKNPENIDILKNINLISGQPIVCVIENNCIVAFYIIENNNLNQVFGCNDKLFLSRNLYDLTILNLKKYNLLKYYLIKIFEKLSFKDINIYANTFERFENKVFYTILHISFDVCKIKNYLSKEIAKFDIPAFLKMDFINNLKSIRMPSKKILSKKIDLNLLGYDIYINTFVN